MHNNIWNCIDDNENCDYKAEPHPAAGTLRSRVFREIPGRPKRDQD